MNHSSIAAAKPVKEEIDAVAQSLSRTKVEPISNAPSRTEVASLHANPQDAASDVARTELASRLGSPYVPASAASDTRS